MGLRGCEWKGVGGGVGGAGLDLKDSGSLSTTAALCIMCSVQPAWNLFSSAIPHAKAECKRITLPIGACKFSP